MILWKHRVAETFEKKDIEVTGVGTGGYMHEDLISLISYCKKDGRRWYVAQVECGEDDVIPVGDGWYEAKQDIPLKESFIPLEEAERKYL